MCAGEVKKYPTGNEEIVLPLVEFAADSELKQYILQSSNEVYE